MVEKIFNWKLNIDEAELKQVINALDRGELIVFPTETVYGIGADTFNSEACRNIFKVKGRPSDNPLIVHVSDYEMLKACVCEISYIEKKLIKTFMPGPFTLILKKDKNIPNSVTAGLDTVAIRMPDNKIAQKIISGFGKPIAAPSANISGKPSGTNIEDIKDELGEKVYALIDGGDTEIGLESTVVRVVDGVPIILRPGAVTADDIIKAVGKVKIDNYVLNEVAENEKVLSPGMKHKHYSPKTKCILVDIQDEDEKVRAINNYSNKNVCFMGIGEKNPRIKVQSYISMGNTLEDICKNIYSKLREADKLNCDLILIEATNTEGLGLAIMNRLLRTCGYTHLESGH